MTMTANSLYSTYTTTHRQLARESRVRNNLAERQVLLTLAGVFCPSFQRANGVVVRSRIVQPKTMPIGSILSSEGSQCTLQCPSSRESREESIATFERVHLCL